MLYVVRGAIGLPGGDLDCGDCRSREKGFTAPNSAHNAVNALHMAK